MAGILTINSSGDGSILSGHSWIVYQPEGQEAVTYGTWGNNPGGLGNGLHTNLEAGRSADVSRSIRLDDTQEAALMAKIKEYQDAGEEAWKELNPCSGFAADAWQTATGESLSHRTAGIISNPSKLKKSIESANKTDSIPTESSQCRPKSSSSFNSVVQRCQN